ncbi:MAG: hypothetical protein ACO1ON_12835 [Nocardioides sp.]
MAELIAFPDVEDVVRQHLEAVLGVAAYGGSTPTDFPATSVTVVRTGGVARSLVVDVATVSVDCRAEASEQEALDLARLVRAHMNAAERDGAMGAVTVYEVVEISGPYLNPDPLNPAQHRYSATYQVAVRGSVA